MERDVKEIIKRNREALGYKNYRLEDVVVAGLLAVNNVSSLQNILNIHDKYGGGLNIILADGLIVGYEI